MITHGFRDRRGRSRDEAVLAEKRLRDSDWAAMARRIEQRRPLSKDLLSRPKTGFYVPVREWLIARSPEWTDRSVRGAIRFLDQTAA